MFYKQFGAYKAVGILTAEAGATRDLQGYDIPTGTTAYGDNGLGDTTGAFIPSTTIINTGGKSINATNQMACSWACRVYWEGTSSFNNRVMLGNTSGGVFLIIQPDNPTGNVALAFDGSSPINIISSYSLNTWYRIIVTYSDNGTNSVYNIWLDGTQVATNVTRTRGTPDFSQLVANQVARVTNRNGTALTNTRVSHMFFFDKTLSTDEVAIIDARMVNI